MRSWPRFRMILACCAVAVAACRKSTEPPDTNLGTATDQPMSFDFHDLTAQSRIEFMCRNGQESGTYSIAQTLGGGGGAFDFDQDGLLDIYLVGGGTLDADGRASGLPGGLFRGLDGTQFQDVTETAGTAGGELYAHGIAIGDFNADGFDDLVITGYQGVLLFQNQGDGSFRQVAQDVGIGPCQWATGAAWGDLNGDGLPDLVVVQYLDWSNTNHPVCRPNGVQQDVCGPEKFRGIGDRLYLSRGDGSFTDASQSCGLRPDGKGLGVVLVDVDNDNRLDIYIANDTDDNFLYLNGPTCQMKEVGVVSGTAQDHRGFANGSMGISVADFNRDGKPDLWVTNFENDSFALYRNDGQGLFTHASGAMGIFAIGSSYVGWGTVIDDLDSDGVDEIVVTNGHVLVYPRSGTPRQLPFLLKQVDGTFKKIDFQAPHYFSELHDGRGLFKCDMDNDGDWDLGFCNLNEPFRLLRNDTRRTNPLWVGIRLIGVQSDRNAVGARMTLLSQGQRRTQFLVGGGSYLSHSDSRLLWTLPANTDRATFVVQWPSGITQSVEITEFTRYHNIIESDSE